MRLKKHERYALSCAKACLQPRADISVVGIAKRKHNAICIQHTKTGHTQNVFFASTPSCHRWVSHLKKDVRHAVKEIDRFLSDSRRIV